MSVKINLRKLRKYRGGTFAVKIVVVLEEEFAKDLGSVRSEQTNGMFRMRSEEVYPGEEMCEGTTGGEVFSCRNGGEKKNWRKRTKDLYYWKWTNSHSRRSGYILSALKGWK